MTTIYDVARLAGVWTAAVSRVLRGSDLMRAETRRRVLTSSMMHRRAALAGSGRT